MVRVSLVETVSVALRHCITAKGKLESGDCLEGPVTAAVRLADSLLNQADPRQAF